jgi:hypothetical protein
MVKEPTESVPRPTETFVAPLGNTGVDQLACAQPDDTNNFAEFAQNTQLPADDR